MTRTGAEFTAYVTDAWARLFRTAYALTADVAEADELLQATPATATGTRVTESFDAERPLGPVMPWLTEKWTGSSDRDADLRRGMTETLARLKAEAERG